MAVGPLAQRRLDEAFSLAISLRPVGSGELLGDAQFQAGCAEQRRSEGHAVIAQHALDGHTDAGEVVHGRPQERFCAVSGLVRVDLREGQAAVVVHGHEDEVPADVSRPLGTVTGDAMADLVKTPELLDVDVQQLARVLTLVALHGLVGAQVAQPRQAGSTQYPADGGPRHAHVRRDARLQEELAAQLDDGQRNLRRDASRRLLWTRGFVQQACGAIGQVAGKPLAGSDRADAVLEGGICCAGATLGDVLNHLQATQVGQSGILMAVHPVWRFEWTGGLAISSLSKPLRVNIRNNLLKLHS